MYVCMYVHRIIESIEASSASVTFAMKEPFKGQTGEDLYALCGANIMNDTPDICMWLKDCLPKVCAGKPVTGIHSQKSQILIVAVFMYVCMYICMYVYIYIHTHTHTHTFIYMRRH